MGPVNIFGEEKYLTHRGEGKGGRYLEKGNIWPAEKKKEKEENIWSGKLVECRSKNTIERWR